MKTLVVYDSFFGNTEQIARAVGDAFGNALASHAEVQTLRVGDVKPGALGGAELAGRRLADPCFQRQP